MLPFAKWPWLPWTSEDGLATIPFVAWPLFFCTIDGVRRCLFRYEVEETDRGRAGRCGDFGEPATCSLA